MRVKKPTSKRTTTRMREGIKKKAFAQQRKNRKTAKRDVTWKSRINKDPGIPASFPYKDRIITEIEDKKRLDDEKKRELRAQRKQEKAAALARGEAVDDAMEDEDVEDDSNPLGALLESAQQAAKAYDGEDSGEEDYEDAMEDDDVVEYQLDDFESDEEDAAETDKSRRAYDKIFKTVVEAADVVLYVLDARDPEATRSRKVEAAVLQNPNKRLILILNKIDLVPTDVLNQWMTFLKSSFPTIPLKAAPGASNSTTFNKGMTQTVTANALMQALKAYANKSNLKRSIIVGVIGYPNVGKSSIINALTTRHGGSHKACPVGNIAGVTTALREVKIDNKLKVLDSPGIVFPDEQSKKSKAQQQAQLAVLSAIPPKQITDPISAVSLLLKKLSKDTKMTDGFKKYYQLPAISSIDLNEFTKQFLIHVSRSRGRLSKGGIPNLEAAASTVLSDWRDGRIIGWTLPKNSRETDEQVSNGPVKTAAAIKSTGEVAQTTIVAEWAKEFDLDGLLGGNFGEEED